MTSTAPAPSTLRSTAAIVITRVLIPLWLGIGAVLKVIDGSPSNLPAALVKWLGGNGIDLRFVLEFSIAVELVVVVAMVLLPSLARTIGILMLAAFVPVLVGDLALGASSCGCFGAVQIPPWVTLVTDLFFLFSLVVIARGVPQLAYRSTIPAWRVVAAGLLSVAAVAAAFGLTAEGNGNGNGLPAPGDIESPGPAEGYYLPEYSSWIGREFRSLELSSWIVGLPDDLDQGPQYVMFYRKDCEHCHELMEVFFSDRLPLPTTAIAVPERFGYPTENVQPFVCGECRLAELPAGYDWFLQTPVLVKLTDGVVECAAEVTAADPVCLDVF
jgi:hypothetical protein